MNCNVSTSKPTCFKLLLYQYDGALLCMLCCVQGAHECLKFDEGARNVKADEAKVGLTWLVSMQKASLAASAFFAKSLKKSIATCRLSMYCYALSNVSHKQLTMKCTLDS